jgi:hypothetical protein
MYGIADPWQRLRGCVTVALLRTAVLPPAGTTQPPTHWTFCMSVNMTQVKDIQLSCSDHLRLVLRTRIPFDPDSVRSVYPDLNSGRQKLLHQKRKKEDVDGLLVVLEASERSTGTAYEYMNYRVPYIL